MPDFMCIGGQKCGTTWLYDKLSFNSGVFLPVKELHFWNNFVLENTIHYDSYFRYNEGRISGDMTPNYSTIPIERIKRIHEVYPNLKVFAILRNPIERSFSAAKMFVGLDNYCTYIKTLDCLQLSDYETWIKNWRQYFDVKLWFFEDMVTRPFAFLKHLSGYLGIDYQLFEGMSHHEMILAIHKGKNIYMSGEVRDLLRNTYYNKIDSLEDYLQVNLQGWKI